MNRQKKKKQKRQNSKTATAAGAGVESQERRREEHSVGMQYSSSCAFLSFQTSSVVFLPFPSLPLIGQRKVSINNDDDDPSSMHPSSVRSRDLVVISGNWDDECHRLRSLPPRPVAGSSAPDPRIPGHSCVDCERNHAGMDWNPIPGSLLLLLQQEQQMEEQQEMEMEQMEDRR